MKRRLWSRNKSALLHTATFCVWVLFQMSVCRIGAAQGTVSPAAPCKNMDPALGAPAIKTSVPVALQRDLEVVRDVSFPELQKKVVKTRKFESSVDYFRTRFSVSRFLLLRPVHYFVEMNPRIANSGPSADSVCAILAHELVHISRMSDGNRLHLFGLVRLISSGYTARFERSTDLEAIRRGYGPGLITFREWVYKNIPAEALKRKQRNYFSPDEIAAIQQMTEAKPELFKYWNKHVPLNLEEIEQARRVNR
jgi:hypothetical protein